jgi:HNH endonuclease
MKLPSDFKITPDGVVYGSRGKPLKHKLHCGYIKVRLRNGWVSLHRLLAETFIPNPLNLETVNHKDGNKLNNSLDNLEWVSRQDNLYHAMDNNLHNWGRTKVINSNGQLFSSQTEAAKMLRISQGNIHRSITKGCRCGGYFWRYAE